MAIYTKLDEGKINFILSNYELGNVKNFEGIKEGIENTNYSVETDKGKYILTIYEKRVNSKDLPFFSRLMLGLSNKNFICPKPISNKNNEYISNFENKKLMIVSYLEGRSKKNLSPPDCKIIGRESAKLHQITKNFNFKRENNLSVKSWRKIFDQVKDKCSQIHPDLPVLIEGNLNDVEKDWPNSLPNGIIHADLFNDNIFFKKNKFSGFIDFYFSCNDFYAFEIAICFNALCFEGIKENLSFNVTKAKKFMEGYNEIRKISDDEKKSIKVLSQGAALRFLLTRVFDYINIVDGAVVKIKDPIEYLKRLEFHKNAKSYEDYLL
ncbi:MAG: homoserine kinase [Candidatus Marinimicrobia bacterium]|nr:homoserine kinase [Candidatus Neomarinimicrobiota bacterium]RPG05390.1 MAG: homoserine kinase [Pelagibacteraceae bacterium TMED247]|tara:strand:+ start:20282 stop:21250 length:969 start_codon:yes stop_codon:yes gene_type:complete